MRHPTIYPTYRYRDADAAIAFLQEAFGFEPRMVDRGDDGRVAHAELAFGHGLVMLGSQRDDWMRTRIPDDVEGVTSSTYLVVSDVDTHHARAKEAGAEIARPLEDTP